MERWAAMAGTLRSLLRHGLHKMELNTMFRCLRSMYGRNHPGAATIMTRSSRPTTSKVAAISLPSDDAGFQMEFSGNSENGYLDVMLLFQARI